MRCRRFRIAFVVLAAFATVASVAWQNQASARVFDCRKASLKVDFVICSDDDLLSANAALSARWSSLYQSLDGDRQQELLREQKTWIGAYAADCGVGGRGHPKAAAIRRAKSCLLDAIQARTGELAAMAAQAATPQNVEGASASQAPPENVSPENLSATVPDGSQTSWARSIYSVWHIIEQAGFFCGALVVPVLLLAGGFIIKSKVLRFRRSRTPLYRRRRNAFFASRLAQAAAQRDVAIAMSDTDLLWAFFLPDHTAAAKTVIEQVLIERGHTSAAIRSWIPSGWNLPQFKMSSTDKAYLVWSARRRGWFGAIRVVAFGVLGLGVILAFFGAAYGVPTHFEELDFDTQAQFMHSDGAALFYRILMGPTYFLVTLSIFVMPVASRYVGGRQLRFILLRPFGDKKMTASLRRFILAHMAGYGGIVTISDQNFKPSRLVMIVGLLANVFVLILNPLVRNSVRVATVKNEKKFRKLLLSVTDDFDKNIIVATTGGQAMNIRCTDAWWKCCVSLYLEISNLVVIDLSNVKEGMAWELDQVTRRGLWERCLLICGDQVDPAKIAAFVKIGPVFRYDAQGRVIDAMGLTQKIHALLADALRGPLTSHDIAAPSTVMGTPCSDDTGPEPVLGTA